MGFEKAAMIVGALIAVVTFVAGGVGFWLMIKYLRFNRRENSLGLSGIDLARRILDDHGLQHIKVKRTGSLLFGNSYSHYFKKVRLRGFIRHQKSLTSMGLGAQKAALAILDKEGDPDMRKRVRLVPMLTFGLSAFLPLILVGALIDYFLIQGNGTLTIVLSCVGLVFYAYAIVLSVMTLKTEKKAQARAYEILANDYQVTAEELADLKELFRLYNIQYINDIVLSALEFVYMALKIAIVINDKKG